jgi:hypothetical protein
MWKIILFHAVISLAISGCQVLKPDQINYNDRKELFEYSLNKRQSLILRNDSNQLVTSSNIDQFKQELEQNKFRYPLQQRQENSGKIRNSDRELTSAYSNISTQILNKDYNRALGEINTMKTLYPDAIRYSDVLFLEGYCYEQLQDTYSSSIAYSNFLRYSSGKYSALFRDYRDFDKNDSLWLLQRNYAKAFLLEENPLIAEDIFSEIKPRFFYSSFHPGYNMNRESLIRGAIGHIWLLPDFSNFSNVTLGMQTYHKLNDVFDINPGIFFSNDIMGANLALPVQLYKSENNNLGVKISPFLNYARIDSLTLDRKKYNVDKSIVNWGAKISLGYYLTQKWSLGTYYKYNSYNAQKPLRIESQDIAIWRDNIFDASAYYHIFTSFSLKTGIRNGRFVAGFLLNGLECSFDFSRSEFIVQLDMY